MKIHKIALVFVAVFLAHNAFAGNKDRAGQMGATELNVNPWAYSSSLFYSNGSYINGIEALKLNVAGLVKQKGTEIGVSYNDYLRGSGISFVDGGFAFDLNDESKMGINIMSFNFGNTYQASVEDPEQEVTFAPSFFNLGLTYAREFSENVAAGIQATVFSENVGDMKASSVSFDMGIQYQGGFNNNTHFGISLRNVGPNFKFTGEGLNQETVDANGNPATRQTRSGGIYLPTQLMLSAARDWFLGTSGSKEFAREDVDHILTGVFSFTSNAYYNDHITGGLDYALKDKFFLRAAFRYESQIFSSIESQTSYTGLAAGLGLKFNLDKEEQSKPMYFDYGFRSNRFNTGIHSVSLKFVIN